MKAHVQKFALEHFSLESGGCGITSLRKKPGSLIAFKNQTTLTNMILEDAATGCEALQFGRGQRGPLMSPKHQVRRTATLSRPAASWQGLDPLRTRSLLQAAPEPGSVGQNQTPHGTWGRVCVESTAMELVTSQGKQLPRGPDKFPWGFWGPERESGLGHPVLRCGFCYSNRREWERDGERQTQRHREMGNGEVGRGVRGSEDRTGTGD